jgi:DNA-binding GntR family transcriptional regulator
MMEVMSQTTFDKLPTGDSRLIGQVADQIRMAILTGRLPCGTHLSAPVLAEQLGVSRTPCREALYLLQRDGLVEITPRHGAVVIKGGLRDAVHLFEIREALDGMAARLAAERATADDIARLTGMLAAYTEAVEVGDDRSFSIIDFDFHGLVLLAAKNPWLAQEGERVNSQLRVLGRALSIEGDHDMAAVLRAHRKIADAIARSDPAAAEEAARAHVAFVAGEVRRRLFKEEREL